MINNSSKTVVNGAFRNSNTKNNKQNLNNYLDFLINYSKQKQEQHVVNEAKKELFSFIDFERVCLDIQKEIITVYRRDQKYHNEDVVHYIKKLTESKPEERERIAQFFSRLTQKQIRAIVSGTKVIINKLNDELDCLCMQVSTSGQYMIFLIAQTYTNALAFTLENIYECQPLLQLEQRKQHEKDSFIAKLTQNNAQIDISLGKKLAAEMIQFLYNKAKNFSLTAFKDSMN